MSCQATYHSVVCPGLPSRWCGHRTGGIFPRQLTLPDAVLFVALEARPNKPPELLLSEHSCALILLQAILHASLDRSALSVEKFARWLRAICTILLARNTAPDRLKAIGYIEQAITVLEDHGGDDVGDEVMTILPFGQVTYPFVVSFPPRRHTPWTNAIGFSRLPTTRGLSAFSMGFVFHVSHAFYT